MSLPAKVSLLAAVLTADLLFFMLFSVQYPDLFEALLDSLPWEDNLEKAIMIIAGLVVAVLSSAAIVYVLAKSLHKTV